MFFEKNNYTLRPPHAALLSDFQRVAYDQPQTNRQLPSNSKETPSQKKTEDVTAPIFQDYTNTPQITFTKEGKIGILSKAKPITQLVIEGGGCKGAVYGQLLEILDRHLNLNQSLEEIAGTSAGAGSAFLMAAGIPPQKINHYLSNAKLSEKLYGKPVQNLKLCRPSLYNPWRSNGFFTANSLIKDILNMTQESASDFYKSIENQQEKIAQIMDDGRASAFIERAKEGFLGGVTFYDLRLLRKLDPRFKELHITGFHREDEKGILFNADKTPDECCHAAVRGSMSIPFFFQPVLMNDKTITDGGEVSNLPSEVFTDRTDYNPEQMLALTFKRDEAAHQILHHPPKKLTSPFEKPFQYYREKTSLYLEGLSAFLGRTSTRREVRNAAAGEEAMTLAIAEVPDGADDSFADLQKLTEKGGKTSLQRLKQKLYSFGSWLLELIDRLWLRLSTLKFRKDKTPPAKTATSLEGKTSLLRAFEEWYGPKLHYGYSFLTGEKDLEAMRSEQKKIRELGLSVLPVAHDGLETFDFWATPEQIKIAQRAASQSAEEYAELRKVMASHRTYESTEEAIAALSEAEKGALWESTRHQAEELLLQISNEKEEVEQFDRFRNLLQKMISSTEKDLPSAFELLQFLNQKTNSPRR